MNFSSITFVFWFLPIVLCGYYLLGKRYQMTFLFMASLLFYAWGRPKHLLLLGLSILVNYILGRAIGQGKPKKLVLLIGLSFNIGMLAFFKCSEMVIGLSFYTFQAISYLVDVYRREAGAQRNLVYFGVYISMFAQLVAGPIVRYTDIEKQLKEHRFESRKFSAGVQRFLTGLGKKMLLANPLGSLWESIKAMPTGEVAAFYAWFGILAFALQIYFDFSGYSDMAIGLGKMFGFDFPENFAYPYLAESVSEFWRRWHISLGAWFKSYIYIPLGGNRKGRLRMMGNLMVVWIFTGFWHGASWNFLLWGLYYGSLIVVEKLWIGNWLRQQPAVIKHGYTLLAVLLGWIIFEFDTVTGGLAYLNAMFSPTFLGKNVITIKEGILLLIGIIGATPFPKNMLQGLKKRAAALYTVFLTIWNGAVALLLVACLVKATFQPFLYFRF